MSKAFQIVLRAVEVCGRCGEKMPWKKIEGTRLRGSQLVAGARCKYCGHKAQIRYAKPST